MQLSDKYYCKLSTLRSHLNIIGLKIRCGMGIKQLKHDLDGLFYILTWSGAERIYDGIGYSYLKLSIHTLIQEVNLVETEEEKIDFYDDLYVYLDGLFPTKGVISES